jgi:histone acetyltransferase (RNA polymerase elongator complex component)
MNSDDKNSKLKLERALVGCQLSSRGMTTSPAIIPVFLPHLGCKERCFFCNQKVTAKEAPSPLSVRRFIEACLRAFPLDERKREKQVAFYGGSFTAIGKDEQIRYLREVEPFLSDRSVDSIRISTRPDALNEEVLSLLREHGVKTVEVGAQSMIDRVLDLSGRGHCAGETVSASGRLRRWGFEVVIHLMIGLPGDTLDGFLQSLDEVIGLRPDFLRIHPTLVLRGAPLESLWRKRQYSPLSLSEAIESLKRGLLRLEKTSIPIARVGLQPARELEEHCITGPYHPALRQLVDSEIFFDMAVQMLRKNQNELQVTLFCHPKDISNARGHGNENIQKLKGRFGLKEILVQGREDIPRGALILQTQAEELSIQREELLRNSVR